MKSIWKKKSLRIACACIAVAVLGMLFAMFTVGGNGNREARDHITAGDKYLSELDYEQAIAEYTAALKIDPSDKKAAKGLEKACLQYAQALQQDVDTGMEEYRGLLQILESSYQLVQRSSLSDKKAEIKVLTEEAEKQEEAEEQKKLEREKKEAEEKRKKKEEQERREKEKAEKQKLIDIYCWEIVNLDIISSPADVEVIEVIEETEDYYLFEAIYGVSAMSMIRIKMDKKTEIGIVTEYYEEDWVNGGWKLMDRYVGTEYNLAITDEVKEAYQKDQERQKELEQLGADYTDKVVAYINDSWKKYKEGEVVLSNVLSTQGLDREVWYSHIEYEASNEPDIMYRFTVQIWLEKGTAEILDCSVYKDGEERGENMQFPDKIKFE